jgi:hypothetical protein
MFRRYTFPILFITALSTLAWWSGDSSQSRANVGQFKASSSQSVRAPSSVHLIDPSSLAFKFDAPTQYDMTWQPAKQEDEEPLIIEPLRDGQE